jgi:VWFA-related protein
MSGRIRAARMPLGSLPAFSNATRRGHSNHAGLAHALLAAVRRRHDEALTCRTVAPSRPWIGLLCFAAFSAPQNPPDFRVNTQLVEVDVVVRSKTGPVAGLKKGDFTVLDNGKQRQIAVFSVQSTRNSAAPASPLPAGAVSNRLNSLGEEPVGATVILWDALNTELQDQAYVRNEVLKYLRTMTPGGPVAVYMLVKTLHVVHDFTDDRDRLIKAVLGTRPQDSVNLSATDLGDLAPLVDQPFIAALQTQIQLTAAQGGKTAALQSQLNTVVQTQQASANAAKETFDYALRDRVFLTATALEAIAEHLSGLPGRKKLAWVSGSFPSVTLDQRNRVGGTQIEVQDFGVTLNKAVRALNNANVAVYPIDPRGLTTGLDMSGIASPSFAADKSSTSPREMGLTASGIDTMNLLAAGTGGRAVYGSNDLAAAIRSVMEDDEVTYRLGFYASGLKPDGAYHTLSVKVAGKNQDVRHRQGYFALDAKAAASGQWRDVLNELMQNPLEATKLGLRASATPVANKPGIYSLEVAVDLKDLHLEHRKDRWVAMLAFATQLSPSPSNKGSVETMQVSLTEDRLRAALRDGYVFRRTMAAGDLTGELRVVVEDPTSQAVGSVSVPVGQK